MDLIRRIIDRGTDILQTSYYRFIWFLLYGKRICIGKQCRIRRSCKLVMKGKSLLIIGRDLLTRNQTYILIDSGKITIGNHVFLNHNVSITCLDEITIKDNCKIANNVVIVDHDHNHLNREEFVTAPVIIGKNVWIASNVTITKGVTIGENAIIGAGSVVTKDIPANCIAVGSPAKIIKYL